MERTLRSKTRKLSGDTRGSATTEYVVLVGAVGLVVMAAIVAIGPVLLADYYATRSYVAAPFP
jgi:hypothetical protein